MNEAAYISGTEDKREALAGGGFTDFLLPLDTSTLKSWFLLADEQGRVQPIISTSYKRCKKSRAVSGSAAIKTTQGLLSLSASRALKHWLPLYV